jgi:hypothetical protein
VEGKASPQRTTSNARILNIYANIAQEGKIAKTPVAPFHLGVARKLRRNRD